MSQPRNALPRSPANILLSHQLVDEPLAQSPTNEAASVSSSFGVLPSLGSSGPSSSQGVSPIQVYPTTGRPVARRQSTETSGGLDYYWSSLAGAGASSSSSSLAISPSPSLQNVDSSTGPAPAHGSSPGAGPPPAGFHPSSADQRSRFLRADSADSFRQSSGNPSPNSAYSPDPSPSHRGAPHNLLLPEIGSVGNLDLHSPGGWSSTSEYSESPVDIRAMPRDDSLDSNAGHSGHTSLFNRIAREDTRASLDSDGTSRHYDPRQSIQSASTYRAHDDHEEDHPAEERTPVPPNNDGRMPSHEHHGALADLSTPKHTPRSSVTSPVRQSTPTRPLASPSAKGYAPTSGRFPFTAPLSLQHAPPSPPTEPQSAPASKSEFGPVDQTKEGEKEDTIKARNRRTMPPVSEVVTEVVQSPPTSSSSAAVVTPTDNGMLSPVKYDPLASFTPEKQVRREPSPGRSPEPPPRSSLRPVYASSRSSIDSHSSHDSSPRAGTPELPRIATLPADSETTPTAPTGREPARPPRSPSRETRLSVSTTLSDLTDMLGGAIDAIGLIDSRETPPPGVSEPDKEILQSSTGSLGPPAEVAGTSTSSQISTSPSSIISAPKVAPSPAPQTQTPTESIPASTPAPLTAHAEEIRKKASAFSLRAGARTSSLTVKSTVPRMPVSRPWPQAMNYNTIKAIRYAGDRASGYARAINDLSRAESGLRDWCAASSSTLSLRPAASPASKSAGMASLGLSGPRSSTYSMASTLTVPNLNANPNARNVSTGSEFPMRADAYSAREIAQRNIDPMDAPNSLPPNLPFPQLAQHYAPGGQVSSGGLGGMKASPSMQSVSSFSSKRGFFSAIGKKSAAKKESSSLGPPAGASAPKKDLRGLPISSPSFTSPPLSGPGNTSPHRSSELTSVSAPGQGRPNISGPIGPRGPRMGTFTPPPSNTAQFGAVDALPRSSLDTGMSRRGSIAAPAPARTSLDGLPQRKQSIGFRSNASMRSTPVSAFSGSPTPREEDVGAMSDILPHVNRAVLRAYLGKYGDQMQAIGMYLEDEKRGKVIRA